MGPDERDQLWSEIPTLVARLVDATKRSARLVPILAAALVVVIVAGVADHVWQSSRLSRAGSTINCLSEELNVIGGVADDLANLATLFGQAYLAPPGSPEADTIRQAIADELARQAASGVGDQARPPTRPAPPAGAATTRSGPPPAPAPSTSLPPATRAASTTSTPAPPATRRPVPALTVPPIPSISLPRLIPAVATTTAQPCPTTRRTP